MLVFQAVLSVGSGDQRTIWLLSGEVTPYNLEEVYAQALNLITAVVLMDEARDTFTAFVHDTHNPALREMFTLFARTMELYASVIRGKMAGEGEGGNPCRA